MSTKKKLGTNREFLKEVTRGVLGVVILIILLVIWLTWDGVYHWFYNSLAPNAKSGTLLIVWLLFLVPLLICGSALLISGGMKAYKLAVPPKEKD